jgi:GNAT superfamily N-acetyltransferase
VSTSAVEIRPFARHDRVGLTDLANRHVAAVTPGASIPVSALLSQMERDTAEVIIDPWVIDRHTLIGVAEDRLFAAAHLKRYGSDERVGTGFKDAGVVDWFIADRDRPDVGAAVLDAALDHLRRWGSRIWYADGNLPCLGVYGIPDAWPHVRSLLEGAGFRDDDGQIEVVFAGDLAAVPTPGSCPVSGVELRRVVGRFGPTFEAHLDGACIGAFEVEDHYGVSNLALAGWADEGNHWVAPDHRGRGVGSWLFRHGCDWLRLGGKERLMTYAIERRAAGAPPAEADAAAWGRYYGRFGLRPITRTRRGWSRQPD